MSPLRQIPQPSCRAGSAKVVLEYAPVMLGKTKGRLPAGRGFADHHSALAQILEMGKGRKAGGMRQGWVQADIDPGDERRNRLRAVLKRIQDRGLALAAVMDQRA